MWSEKKRAGARERRASRAASSPRRARRTRRSTRSRGRAASRARSRRAGRRSSRSCSRRSSASSSAGREPARGTRDLRRAASGAMRVSRSRSSWKRVRISSSDAVEKTYETRVGEERQRAGEAEERAADGRGGEPHARGARLREAGRSRKLCERDDRAERAALTGAEEDAARSRRRTRSTRIAQNAAWCVSTSAASVADRRGADDIGGDHQAPAVEAVGRDAGDEVEEEQRRELRGADVARLRRGNASPRARAADTRGSRSSSRTSRAAAPPGAA